MTILPSMLGRRANVGSKEVITVGAYTGGMLNETLFFVVLYQETPTSPKYIETYKASGLTFPPQEPNDGP